MKQHTHTHTHTRIYFFIYSASRVTCLYLPTHLHNVCLRSLSLNPPVCPPLPSRLTLPLVSLRPGNAVQGFFLAAVPPSSSGAPKPPICPGKTLLFPPAPIVVYLPSIFIYFSFLSFSRDSINGSRAHKHGVAF